MFWQLLLFVVILSIFFYQNRDRRLRKFYKEIKNDIKSLPVIGHGLHFIGNTEDMMRSLHMFGLQAMKQGGITTMQLGNRYTLVAVDPEIIDIIMKTRLEKHEIMKYTRFYTGNGSIFAPVYIWRPRRKVLAPTFSQKNLKLFVNIFYRQSLILADQLQSIAGVGTKSIWKYITSYSMDSVCETVLGVQINAQSNPDQPFLDAIAGATQLVVRRTLQPWLQNDFIYKMTPAYKKETEYRDFQYKFIREIIETKRKQLDDQTDSCSKTIDNNKEHIKTFLDLLIEGSGGKEGFTNEELREEISVLIIAGTDTSAVGMAFTILLLARHPEVQEKVFQELKEVFGDTDRPIVADDLALLKYLEAVIKESLRLYPPVPIITRDIDNDVILSSGMTIPAGCGVFMHIWGMHRNPKYWGSDADIFRPERFLDSSLKYPAFMPFSYGPRNCLGYRYAMLSMKVALASILRRYIIRPPAETTLTPDSRNEMLRVKFEVMLKHVDNFSVQLESRI